MLTLLILFLVHTFQFIPLSASLPSDPQAAEDLMRGKLIFISNNNSIIPINQLTINYRCERPLGKKHDISSPVANTLNILGTKKNTFYIKFVSYHTEKHTTEENYWYQTTLSLTFVQGDMKESTLQLEKKKYVSINNNRFKYEHKSAGINKKEPNSVNDLPRVIQKKCLYLVDMLVYNRQWLQNPSIEISQDERITTCDFIANFLSSKQFKKVVDIYLNLCDLVTFSKSMNRDEIEKNEKSIKRLYQQTKGRDFGNQNPFHIEVKIYDLDNKPMYLIFNKEPFSDRFIMSKEKENEDGTENIIKKTYYLEEFGEKFDYSNGFYDLVKTESHQLYEELNRKKELSSVSAKLEASSPITNPQLTESIKKSQQWSIMSSIKNTLYQKRYATISGVIGMGILGTLYFTKRYGYGSMIRQSN